MNKKNILGEIRKRQDKLKDKGVKKIGLFGSYLKGKQKRGSDIDFLVSFDKIDSDNYFDVWFYLENVFKKKIDLVIDESLRKELSYVRKEAEYVIL